MSFFLTRQAALKWLETPSVYQVAKDELYELDNDSFRFFRECATEGGCASKDSAFVDYCIEEGLLSTERNPAQRPSLKKAPDPSLRYLELQITSACNLRCKHCYLGDTPKTELSPGRTRAVLREFEELQGLRVLITGGEPLLHTKFDEINEMLPDFLMRKVLFTNGSLLERETIKRLKVNEVQVSIDGLERAHDSLRGNGMYTRSLNAIRTALDAGFDVSISTMVHPANLADFDAMERMFKDLGVKDWTVDVPCVAGRLRENSDFAVTPEQGGKYLVYGFGGGMHATGLGHACGLHLMAVLPDGAAAKCTFFSDKPVGTIEEGLRVCWGKIKPARIEALRCDCEYREVCRGGCRYRAELFGGKGGKDPYRCSMYGILKE